MVKTINITLFYKRDTVSIKEANQIAGSIESIHTAVIMKNYYKPDLKSSVISCDHLLKVALANYSRKQVRLDYLMNLREYANKINHIGRETRLITRLEMFTNVLYTLDEQNEDLLNIVERDNLIEITQDELSILKSLDTSLGRKSTVSSKYRFGIQYNKKKSLRLINQNQFFLRSQVNN